MILRIERNGYTVKLDKKGIKDLNIKDAIDEAKERKNNKRKNGKKK